MSVSVTAASIIVNKGYIRAGLKVSPKDAGIVNVSLRCLKSLWGGRDEAEWKWQGTPCPAYSEQGNIFSAGNCTDTDTIKKHPVLEKFGLTADVTGDFPL